MAHLLARHAARLGLLERRQARVGVVDLARLRVAVGLRLDEVEPLLRQLLPHGLGLPDGHRELVLALVGEGVEPAVDLGGELLVVAIGRGGGGGGSKGEVVRRAK